MLNPFLSAKLRRTEEAIENYRQQIDSRQAENYGFASMAAVPYAHIVANILRKKRLKGTDVSLAPNPKDIVGYLFVICFCRLTWSFLDMGEHE